MSRVKSMSADGLLAAARHPSTLHASLLARLDRLASVKNVAQPGAVIGRQFSYAPISATAGVSETSLRDTLSQHVAAKVIYHRPRSRPVRCSP
jgi:predicted ATPase